MKTRLGCALAFVLALGLFSLSTPSEAQAKRPPGSFGIGIGSSTLVSGLSFKTPAGSFTFQGVVGTRRGRGLHYGRYRGDSLGLAGDFLFEMPTIASGSAVELGWNYGLGVGVGVGGWGGATLGGTGVVGLELNFVPAPIDLVLEYRPGIYFGDRWMEIEFVDLTGHLRFWF